MPGIESVILERPIFPIDEIDKYPAKYENIYNEVDKFMYQSLDAFDLDFCDVYGRFRVWYNIRSFRDRCLVWRYS